jgi:hypothetical protein
MIPAHERLPQLRREIEKNPRFGDWRSLRAVNFCVSGSTETPPGPTGFFCAHPRLRHRLQLRRWITMEIPHSTVHGIWLPLVTPFRDQELDETSLRRLVRHYAAEPVDGLILAATTGEGLTLDDDEVERLVAVTAAELNGLGRRLPLYLGLSGSDTRKMVKALGRTMSWAIDGYLVACPYYTRPSQLGLYRHFAALADHTGRPILIYNIPYRTGVNMSNETLLRLSRIPIGMPHMIDHRETHYGLNENHGWTLSGSGNCGSDYGVAAVGAFASPRRSGSGARHSAVPGGLDQRSAGSRLQRWRRQRPAMADMVPRRGCRGAPGLAAAGPLSGQGRLGGCRRRRGAGGPGGRSTELDAAAPAG